MTQNELIGLAINKTIGIMEECGLKYRKKRFFKTRHGLAKRQL